MTSVTDRQSFLAGTMIRTLSGEKRVEDILVGDRIAASVDGRMTGCDVIQTGHYTVTAGAGKDDVVSRFPIRIMQSAIADDVPCRDLLVGPAHFVAFGNYLIPTHRLENGATIYYDHGISLSTHYHFATVENAVVWANNLPCRSAIPTEEAILSVSEILDESVSLFGMQHDGEMALQVATSDYIEPIARGIQARAAHMGFRQEGKRDMKPSQEITCQVVDARGRAVAPIRHHGRTLLFNVKTLQGLISIRSPAARPCDVIGPFIDDRRNLGVLIGEITIIFPDRVEAMTRHLSEPNLFGWHGVEAGQAMRWTAGQAVLPMEELLDGQARILAIEIKAFGPYVAEEDVVSTLAQLWTR
ncbi:Hint domain-containing protein [Candidatus Kirkpatrickella diaphorinae]|uniref:Hint domain-containing protein n=1 Tax=Candidatus Kirkpatrickella diaphorinae TaxID=2984322 RepID=A0ABY6GMH9_9PROT|nr:Hint domain-containing protein [Candidatus Kirkpatrickella diaphorinae]UYH52135.1 Hint domain-containing protein [Candidatus Kirkpatrickella diaphorinae]